MVEQKQTDTIRVYAVGGGGTNLGARLETYRAAQEGFAPLDICYADTSDSNLIGLPLALQNFYRIKSDDPNRVIDGSGGLRTTNLDEYEPAVREYLQRFKPAKWNIIVGTVAGGTGSVFGPILARELMQRGEAVVVISVGSVAAGQDIRNTIGGLRTYAAMAVKANQPLVMAYYENASVEQRHESDEQVEIMMCSLSALFSGQNRELDTEDLRNLLRFDRVTPYRGVQLARLQLVRGMDPAVGDNEVLLAAATLAQNPESSGFAHRVEARSIGYFQHAATVEILGKAPFHFVLTDGYYSRQLDKLESIKQEFAAEKDAIRQSRSLIAGVDVHSSGVVI